MTEKDLKSIIDIVILYFKEITGDTVDMGVPYVKNSEPVALDYTGVIGISGSNKGGIYVTSDAGLLKEISEIILGPGSSDEESIVDLVGEIANTIAGNMRKNFGNEFMISVPIVLRGRPGDILLKLNPPVFVIPITWKEHKAFLSVGLE